MKDQEQILLTAWLQKLETAGSRFGQLVSEEERKRYSTLVLHELTGLLAAHTAGKDGKQYKDKLHSLLEDLTANFAERGLTPSETATYVLSLKEVLFNYYQSNTSSADIVKAIWETNQIIDDLALFTFEAFTQARERIIKSQSQALAELSTPVIQVWEGIIALPLVGAIDSARAKEIMEKLLEAVVAQEADIVIIDITGVPVVDTQVANRLMRTVESVRLLGTQSIITGINPIVAQTLVQLGVDLTQLTTKASLRAGLQQAFRQLKLKVVRAEAVR